MKLGYPYSALHAQSHGFFMISFYNAMQLVMIVLSMHFLVSGWFLGF
jgi:hypothetical protein